jgi:hypothetical protein
MPARKTTEPTPDVVDLEELDDDAIAEVLDRAAAEQPEPEVLHTVERRHGTVDYVRQGDGTVQRVVRNAAGDIVGRQ